MTAGEQAAGARKNTHQNISIYNFLKSRVTNNSQQIAWSQK